MNFSGQVTGKILSVQFAFSGTVASVTKTAGEKVAKGEMLANLNTKIYQIELDRQLADYQRIRADFDKATDEEKRIKQPNLDISVKDVELAKQKLDLVNLYCPVDGVIIESENLVPGLNVTPANSAIKILDLNSLTFVFQVNQDQLENFFKPVKIKIKFDKPKMEIETETLPVTFGENGKFEVIAKLPTTENLVIGLIGTASPN